MSRTYKVTGINLKSMPMGESDRLLTILTQEQGLVQVLAMGARKHHSSLAGRSGLFVVNQLLIVKGKTLDKLTQAETLASYPGLSQDLKKLTASQYLAELCLCQALSNQPQNELFTLLNQLLHGLQRSPSHLVLPYLTYAIFQLLTLAGVAPLVYRCGIRQTPLLPDLHTPNWQAGFSIPTGGTVTLEALPQAQQRQGTLRSPAVAKSAVRENQGTYRGGALQQGVNLHRPISAIELALLQAIAQLDPGDTPLDQVFTEAIHPAASLDDWLTIEWLLRHYAQYYFDRPIRSATLINTCFMQPPSPPASSVSKRP